MSIALASNLINGKSVAVVGNGIKILQRNDGLWIDEHDVVIRFNFEFPIPSRSKNIGNRTDIMICARGLLKRVYTNKLRWDSICRRNYNTYIVGRHPTKFLKYHLPSNSLKECQNLISKQPTTGAITVHSLMTFFNPVSCTVFGFDGQKSGTLSENAFPKKRQGRLHRPKREQAWLESIKDKITVVEYQ